MNAVRRRTGALRPVRLALLAGAGATALSAPAFARQASQGYPVGSSASAVAAQTFRGSPSGVSPSPAAAAGGDAAPAPALPSLGGAPNVAPPAPTPMTRTAQQAQAADAARRAAERQAQFDDGLDPDAFYLEADLVIRDDNAKTITARGGVESRFDGRTLRANEVTYDQTTGVITATGKAQLIDADGNVEFADELVLDDDRATGFARNFSARMENNVTMAASTAVRRSPSVNELNNALYTPCPLCADDPSKEPSWSFRAEKVVEDRAKQVVYYRKATFYLWGVPTFYAPVFWHTSPAATRGAGFLTPKISLSKRRGLSYEQPYLFVLGPSSDIIVSPQLNAKVNPLLNFNYRQRFYSGTMEFRGGFTHDQDFDNKGEKFGDDTWRSYLFAKGRFDLNDNWLWGFSVERASEDLVLDKYNIDDVYLEEARGLFPDQDRRLSSQLYAIRQDDRSFLSISAVDTQSLIPGDNDRMSPFIAPLVEARWDPETEILGGRLRTRAQAVVLTRRQSHTTGSTPGKPYLPGIDSRRASFDADWRADFTAPIGARLSPFVQARGNLYDISDLSAVSGAFDDSKRTGFASGVLGADLSMPLAKRVFNRGVMVLEPLAQVAISPESKGVVIGRNSRGEPIYFNEDGVSLEFEETNLFKPNKFPGFDLYEGGRRVNLAGRATYITDNGLTSMVFVGRSFRNTNDPIIPTRSGLATKSSDWIVGSQVEPMRGLKLVARARLDADTKEVRRLETGFEIANEYGRGNVSYRRDEVDINGDKIQSLNANLRLNVTQRWQVGLFGDRSIEEKFWKKREIGLIYHDDCIAIEFLYQREDQFTNTPTGPQIRPNQSLLVRLNLATLGDTGYSQ